MNALKNINALLNKINPTDGARAGWCAQQALYNLHPAVLNALEVYEPEDWQAIFWEYPYVAVSDPTRLAFSRNAQHLATDRQTLTTVPRYLKRHFPMLGDHVIRDLALYNGSDTFEFVDDIRMMIGIVETCRIWSCMQGMCAAAVRWMKDNDATFDETDHPYCVYDPDFGWKLAIRRDRTGEVVGRALVHEDSHGDSNDSIYVRTYMADGSRGNKADPNLEAWLESQGVKRRDEWKIGTQLARVETRNGGYRMPYIDGDTYRLEDCGDCFEISRYGEYEAQSTSGEINTGETCEECGDRQDEDDMTWVGQNMETHVCNSCCDSRYTYVQASRRHGDNYFIENRFAVEVDGDYYDEDNLPDHIVQLENGDYAHIDNVVEVDGDYYLTDDDDIVYLEDSNEYALIDDCWQDCDGKWHSSDEESLEIDGKTYLQSDCEMDDLTDLWYAPGTEMVDLPSGKQAHPSNPAVLQVELI